MPKKPAKYGIKSWVACDARSSYAWKMQIYTGKPITTTHEREGGREGLQPTTLRPSQPLSTMRPEKNQAMRVVLDVTEGLENRNVTCDNFFTSYELAQQLLKRGNNTLVGTLRKNKPEIPADLLLLSQRRNKNKEQKQKQKTRQTMQQNLSQPQTPPRGRNEVFSSVFAFTRTATLVSYVPKKYKNVLLLSTLHVDAAVNEDRRDRKPEIILHYNRNKGGVDNLDKVVGTYSCRRMTARWPLAVFHNIIDVSAYNAFVLWREIHPDWMTHKRNKRRLFLERLGFALVSPLINRRTHPPRTPASALLVRDAQKEDETRNQKRRRRRGISSSSSSSSSSSRRNGGRGEEEDGDLDGDEDEDAGGIDPEGVTRGRRRVVGGGGGGGRRRGERTTQEGGLTLEDAVGVNPLRAHHCHPPSGSHGGENDEDDENDDDDDDDYHHHDYHHHSSRSSPRKKQKQKQMQCGGQSSTSYTGNAVTANTVSKRKRCQICPSNKDRKTNTVCCRCNIYICRGCAHVCCPECCPSQH